MVPITLKAKKISIGSFKKKISIYLFIHLQILLDISNTCNQEQIGTTLQLTRQQMEVGLPLTPNSGSHLQSLFLMLLFHQALVLKM